MRLYLQKVPVYYSFTIHEIIMESNKGVQAIQLALQQNKQFLIKMNAHGTP